MDRIGIRYRHPFEALTVARELDKCQDECQDAKEERVDRRPINWVAKL